MLQPNFDDTHLAGQEVRTAIGGLLPYLDHLELTGAPLQRNPTALLNGWQRSSSRGRRDVPARVTTEVSAHRSVRAPIMSTPPALCLESPGEAAQG